MPARYRRRTRFDPRTGARIELQNTIPTHRPTLRSSQATLQAPSKFSSPDAPTIFITLIHHRPVAVSFRAPPLYRYIPSHCILKLLLFCRLFSVVPVPTFKTEIPARYRCRTRFDPRTGARIELQNTTSAHRPTLRSSQQHFKRRANSPAQLHQLYSSRLHSVRRHEHHTTLGMAQPNQRNQRTLHLLIHHQPVAVSFRAPPLYRYIPSHCISQLLLFCRLFSVIPVLIFETEMPAPYRCRPLSTQGPGSHRAPEHHSHPATLQVPNKFSNPGAPAMLITRSTISQWRSALEPRHSIGKLHITVSRSLHCSAAFLLSTSFRPSNLRCWLEILRRLLFDPRTRLHTEPNTSLASPQAPGGQAPDHQAHQQIRHYLF